MAFTWPLTVEAGYSVAATRLTPLHICQPSALCTPENAGYDEPAGYATAVRNDSTAAHTSRSCSTSSPAAAGASLLAGAAQLLCRLPRPRRLLALRLRRSTSRRLRAARRILSSAAGPADERRKPVRIGHCAARLGSPNASSSLSEELEGDASGAPCIPRKRLTHWLTRHVLCITTVWWGKITQEL